MLLIRTLENKEHENTVSFLHDRPVSETENCAPPQPAFNQLMEKKNWCAKIRKYILNYSPFFKVPMITIQSMFVTILYFQNIAVLNFLMTRLQYDACLEHHLITKNNFRVRAALMKN